VSPSGGKSLMAIPEGFASIVKKLKMFHQAKKSVSVLVVTSNFGVKARLIEFVRRVKII